MTVTTFSFTTGATVSSWTVPNHTGLVTITAIGGGGDGGRVPGAVGGAWAGGGGNIRATGTIPAGTVLTIAAWYPVALTASQVASHYAAL